MERKHINKPLNFNQELFLKDFEEEFNISSNSTNLLNEARRITRPRLISVSHFLANAVNIVQPPSYSDRWIQTYHQRRNKQWTILLSTILLILIIMTTSVMFVNRMSWVLDIQQIPQNLSNWVEHFSWIVSLFDRISGLVDFITVIPALVLMQLWITVGIAAWIVGLFCIVRKNRPIFITPM